METTDLSDLKTLFSLETKGESVQPNLAPSASALAFLEQIHRRNSETLKAIILERGWPSGETLGEKTEAAAFLIVHHADYDPVFQRACHQLMLECAALGETKLGYLAFLTDRILSNCGLQQRFGTQVREVSNGCFVPKPMEDAEKVDTLRERAGLGETLTDYLQRVNDGDLLLYRPLLNGYAEQLEERKEHKVIEFPKKPNHH